MWFKSLGSIYFFCVFQVVELVEIEMREMLTDFGYDGNKIPMVMGSALKALNDDNSEIGIKTRIFVMKFIILHV